MLRPGFGKVRAALHVLHRDTGLTHATAIHQPLHAPCSVVPPEPPQIRGIIPARLSERDEATEPQSTALEGVSAFHVNEDREAG